MRMRTSRAERKVEGGKLVQVHVVSDGHIIKEVKITGDFFICPETALGQLEKELMGKRIEDTDLAVLISSFFTSRSVQSAGVAAEDIASVLLDALSKSD